MELIQINAFVSLAKTLHMPQTAQELNTSPSHISKLITSLEAELGVKLFDRAGRGMLLNEHGKLFYEYVSPAIQLMNDGQAALKNVRNSVLGTVTIGSYAFSSILHPCVNAFAQDNPHVNFNFNEIKQQDPNVLMSTTDIVLTATKNGTYTMQSYFPYSRKILVESFYAVISPKLIQFSEKKETICMKEICQFPMVEVSPSPFYRNWVFQNDDTQHMRDTLGISIRIGYIANDFYSKISMLEEGIGFGLLPEVCIAAALKIAPSLQVFGIDDYPIYRKILVACKHRDQMTAAARAFWDFLLKYYQLEPDQS